MIKTILLGFVALLFVALIACSEKEVVGEPVKESYLTVKVDGQEKRFSDVQGRWIEGGHTLEITATNSGSEWITINVLSEHARVPAGTFTIDDGSAHNILSIYGLINNEQQHNFTATSETIAPEDRFKLEIKKIDNGSGEGTFSGVLVRVAGLQTLGTVILTDGKFKTTIKPN